MAIRYHMAVYSIIYLRRLNFFLKRLEISNMQFQIEKVSFLEGLASDLCCLPSRIEVRKRASYFKRKFVL